MSVSCVKVMSLKTAIYLAGVTRMLQPIAHAPTYLLILWAFLSQSTGHTSAALNRKKNHKTN